MEQRDFLRKKLMKKTREQISEKFAGKEIHIIKAVNLLTDLDSINNLMNENASEWKVRQPTGEAETAYNELEKNTQSISIEKEKLQDFVIKEMESEFPNFSAIATPVIGAKLLASAGSKKRLCFMPASTIQVLGAEKALFAHLRKNAKSPKHGHLFNHPLLQNLPRYKRGTAARVIAGKLSIALKVDYFNGENNSSEVKKELEERINEIAAKTPTPKQEQNEANYDSINTERRKEQFDKENKKKDYRREEQQASQSGEHKTFTPEERRAFFEKNGMRRPAQQESRGNQWSDRAPSYPRRESSFGRDRGPSRSPGFGPRREGPSFGGGYGGRDSRGSSSYGPRRESFGPRREGSSFAPRRSEGGFAPRRDFAPRGDYGPREEGSYGSERSFGGGFNRGPRREGSTFGERRENRYSTGGRRAGKPRKFVKKY
ncbi:MAG: hypothetical protein WCW44_05550 [archaeon]|jgi:hypothetical protein